MTYASPMAASNLQDHGNFPDEGWWMEEEREALVDKCGPESGSDCIFGSSEEQEQCFHVPAPTTDCWPCHPLSRLAGIMIWSSTPFYNLIISFPVIPLTTNIFYFQRRTYLIGKWNQIIQSPLLALSLATSCLHLELFPSQSKREARTPPIWMQAHFPWSF